MRKILLLIGCLLFIGCAAENMSRQEVITAMKECQDGGMQAAIMSSYWTGRQVEVRCYPFKETPDAKD